MIRGLGVEFLHLKEMLKR